MSGERATYRRQRMVDDIRGVHIIHLQHRMEISAKIAKALQKFSLVMLYCIPSNTYLLFNSLLMYNKDYAKGVSYFLIKQ